MDETMTRTELLEREQAAFDNLFATLSKLTPPQATAPAMDNGWSVKDNTAHLAFWLDYATTLIESGGQNALPDEDDTINQRIYEENKDRGLNDVIGWMMAARQQFRAAVESLPEQAVNDPDYFPWRNGRPLLPTLLGNSSEHYDEHLTYLQPYLDSLQGAEDEPLPTKAELLERDAAGFAELEAILAQMSDEQMTAPAMNLGWSVKDNLAHLGYWQRHAITMFEQDGRRLIPAGEEHDVSNARIYAENKDRNLADVQTDLRQTNDHYRRMVAALPDEAWSNPRYFTWRAPELETALWLLVGNGYEHYEEHLGYLQPYLASLQQAAPPPPTKAELLARDAASFTTIEAIISQLSDEQMTAPAMDGGWSVKDNLAHLTAWQRDMIEQFKHDGQSTLPSGDEDAINAQIYAQHKDRPLAEVLADLRQSHADYRRLVEQLPDDAWNDPHYLAWHPHDYSWVWMLVSNSYGHNDDHLDYLHNYLTQLGISKLPSS